MSWSLTPSEANPFEGFAVFATGASDFDLRAGDLLFDLLFERFFWVWSPRYWVVTGWADILENGQHARLSQINCVVESIFSA